MSLIFPDGQPFATGMTAFQYRPATAHETTPRAILDVVVEGVVTRTVVDTGGIYLLCNPRLATRLNLDRAEAISGLQSILFRGMLVHGRLYRMDVTLLADEGADFSFQATAFVPDHQEEESWGDLPSILGLYGCLERARFAIDPFTETFYFGPTSDTA
jgi:hypothetical protein